MSGPAAASRDSSINRRIFQAIIVVGLGSLLPKLGLVGRDIGIAAQFGVADQVDAYLVALLIPSMVAQILAQSYAVALVPLVMRRREAQGSHAATELAARAVGFGLVILALVVVALWLAEPVLLAIAGPGFPPPKRALAGSYLAWLAPVVLFAAILWGALLNARERFATVSMLPAITPVLCIAVLLSPLVAGGMGAVAIATLMGTAIEATLLAIMANRAGFALLRIGWDREFGDLLRQGGPLAMGLVFVNGGLLIDQLCASIAGNGAVAILSYGNKLTGMLIAVTAAPLSAAVFPYFSSLAAQRDVARLRHLLVFWSVLIVAATVPVVAGVCVFSEPLVRLLFERGNFTAENTALVVPIQQVLLLQLPFYLLGTLGSRMLSASSMNRTLLQIAAANFAANIVLDLLLLRIIGLPGIAFARTTVTVSASLLMYRALLRRLASR